MSLTHQTLETAVGWFLFHCEYEKRLNPKTLQAYTSDLNQMVSFMREAGLSLISQVTPDVLRAYLKSLAAYKAKTIKRKVASAKAFFNYLEQEFEDYHNPLRKVRVRIKVPLMLPNVLTLAEIGQILSYLYEQRDNASCDRERQREKQLRLLAMVELLFGAGLRVSELCTLRLGDIDLREGLVRVYGKGSRERVIQICQAPIISALEDYLLATDYRGADATRPLFLNLRGDALDAQSVRASIKKLAREAGINKRVTPHTFRHTLATLLLEEGVDIKYIQTILGHSSLSTTQIYTHVTNTRQKIILRDFHPRRRLLASSDAGKR